MKKSKKSETLEVRISYDDKLALQAKAAKEDRTVSHVIRGLISDYLKQPETRSKPNRMMELLMTFKSKPKSAFAVALSCLALPFAVSSLAAAEELTISIDGEYSQPYWENGTEGKRVRSFENEIIMESNGIATFEHSSPISTLKITIETQEVPSGVILKFTISDNDEIIGKPNLTVDYDFTAKIEFGHEDGSMFSMNTLPKRH